MTLTGSPSTRHQVIAGGRVDEEEEGTAPSLVQRTCPCPFATCPPGSELTTHHTHPLPSSLCPEEVYGSLAQYYDAQYLSLRSATYRCVHVASHCRLWGGKGVRQGAYAASTRGQFQSSSIITQSAEPPVLPYVQAGTNQAGQRVPILGPHGAV